MKKRKNVNFSDKTMVILIPYEEQKGRLWKDIVLKEEWKMYQKV